MQKQIFTVSTQCWVILKKKKDFLGSSLWIHINCSKMKTLALLWFIQFSLLLTHKTAWIQLGGFKVKRKGSHRAACVQYLGGALLIWTKQNLLMNSSTDFEPNFETRNIYWYVPHQNFFIQCKVSRWHCSHFSKKWPKSNFNNTFTIRKPWVTPNFCN